MEMYIEILTSLLTGGVLVLFIESQQLVNSVRDRFDFIMRPFMKSLTGYLRFLSYYKNSYIFKKSDFVILQKDLTYLSSLGGKSIVAGRNIPVDFFSAEELQKLCEKINNIWYVISQNHESFYSNVYYKETAFLDDCHKYLSDISSKYMGEVLDSESLEKISGSFYSDIYHPIEDIPYEYEAWEEKDSNFRIISYISIGTTLLSILVLLTFGNCFVDIVYGGICFSCLCLFGLQLFLNIILYRFSINLFK